MNWISFNIHNLVTVLVDSRVSRQLQDSINFQIGYFRTTIQQPASGSTLVIKPYESFGECVDLFNMPHQNFHLYRHYPPGIFHDPASRVLIHKNDVGFTIYASQGNFIFHLFLQLLLIGHGITLVHAAAIARNNKIILIPGAGGVGKTAILGEAVNHHGCKILGDDIILLSRNGTCLSFPRSFVLKEYHRTIFPEFFANNAASVDQRSRGSDSWKKTFIRFIRMNAPFMGLTRSIINRFNLAEKVPSSLGFSLQDPPPPPYLATAPVKELFGYDAVAESGTIDKTVFLVRGGYRDFSIEQVDAIVMAQRMNSIIHHEWVDGMRMFFTMSALGLFELHQYFQRVFDIMVSSITGRPCLQIKIPEQATPEELTGFFISHV